MDRALRTMQRASALGALGLGLVAWLLVPFAYGPHWWPVSVVGILGVIGLALWSWALTMDGPVHLGSLVAPFHAGRFLGRGWMAGLLVALSLGVPVVDAPRAWVWGWFAWDTHCFAIGHWFVGQATCGGPLPIAAVPTATGVFLGTVSLVAWAGLVLLVRGAVQGRIHPGGRVLWTAAWVLELPVAVAMAWTGQAPGVAVIFGALSVAVLHRRPHPLEAFGASPVQG